MSPYPTWNNPRIELYHGTNEAFALDVKNIGVDTSVGRPNTDFGTGFYTTTYLLQAQEWAEDVVRRRGGVPAVVKLTVDRLALRSMRTDRKSTRLKSSH